VCSTIEYRVVHETAYDYSEPVPICQNQIRMRPRSGTRLSCSSSELSINPCPDRIDTHQDYFGNLVDSFAIEFPHSSLKVRVVSEVEVTAYDAESLNAAPPWKQIAEGVESGRSDSDLLSREFIFASRRIPKAQSFAKYANETFDSTESILDAVGELTERIHQDFRYEQGATHVDTTTEEAFDLRAGVCQDFAHIEIACLRSIGLPAKYVSGYLRTVPPPGQPRQIGADASHAWISVYMGAQLGWIEFDPTNACRVHLDHIPVCTGRDYSDVSPMRGIVMGGGKTRLSVSVDVSTADETSQRNPSETGGK